MNFDICLILIFAQSSVIRSKLSKPTRTDTEAGEVTQTEVTSEEVTQSYLALQEVLDAVKLKQSTISYEKLRNILLSDARNSDNICSRNEGNIFKSDLIYKSRRKFWVRFMIQENYFNFQTSGYFTGRQDLVSGAGGLWPLQGPGGGGGGHDLEVRGCHPSRLSGVKIPWCPFRLLLVSRRHIYNQHQKINPRFSGMRPSRIGMVTKSSQTAVSPWGISALTMELTRQGLSAPLPSRVTGTRGCSPGSWATTWRGSPTSTAATTTTTGAMSLTAPTSGKKRIVSFGDKKKV